MKKKVIIILIIIVASAAGLFNSIVTSANRPKDYVKVYYFHGDFRCTTCKTIEQFTRDAVEQIFEKELEAGLVKLEVVNFDKKKNKGFVDKYKLYNQALVMVRFANDKQVEWKDCPKIWENVADRDKFFKYLKNEVNKYLAKK